VKQETEEKAGEIGKVQEVEFRRVEEIFKELRRCLEEREAKVKEEYKEQNREVLKRLQEDLKRIGEVNLQIQLILDETEKFNQRLSSFKSEAVVKQSP
jgi:hypothetical protein